MVRALASALVFASMFAAGCSTENADVGTNDEDLTAAKATGLFLVLSNDATSNVATVKRANATQTKCTNGKAAASCSVTTLDLGAMGLSATKAAKLDAAFRAGHAIVQGTLKLSDADPKTNKKVSEIVVTAAWVGAGGNDLDKSDKIYLAQHAVQTWMCLQAHPCPNINETPANGTKTTRIEDVILDGVGASKTELSKAKDAMLIGGGGLLVAGANVKEGSGASAVTNLEAVDFYLPY